MLSLSSFRQNLKKGGMSVRERTSKIVFSLALLGCMFTSAFALTNEEIAWLDDNIVSASDKNIVTKSSSSNWIGTFLTTKGTGTPVMIKGGTPLYLQDKKTEDDLSERIGTSISNAAASGKVSDITNGLNLSADTGGAAAMLSGFTPIIELVLGIIVTLITIGMTVYSSFDIAYIAFPVFRNKCEDAKVSGTNSAMVKKGANGEAALRWVTDDAQFAVQQGSVESGKSPWSIYFGKRIATYIMLAIILFILLTGNIQLIANIAIKLVSGIMDVLSGLA